LSLLLAAALAGSTAAEPPPWQRTEDRAPCANASPLRQPYFGDLHVHTLYSADAHIFGTRVDPRGAYDFARGGTVTLPDETEAQTRTARIDRPLDFAAVTDHAEFFGEVYICATPDTPGHDDPMCELLRQADGQDRFLTTVRWLFPAGIPNPPPSHAFCFAAGVDCDAAAVSAWREMQAAAEGAYDRSAACSFTTFVGYEHTASPLGRHLHRNVIFRNEHVPAFAASQLETHAGGTPQGVWSAIEADCLEAGAGCDAVVIPHNSNLSGGEQWLDPADAAEAARRQAREPLVEIFQQKAGSECRFDRLAGRGLGTADELCTFEQNLVPHEFPDTAPPPIDEYPRRNLVRNVLKDGLAFEERLGVNPFQLGFVGGTDTHNATAGNTEERGWEGGQGDNDAGPAVRIADELRTNPGGLTVVWAEENSRDAIFTALQRRETYATSGTRPVVRFFGGHYRGLECTASDLVASAYRDGTPMGGELGSVRGGRSPDFLVSAMKDPLPGADLQRIQVVKGWVDGDGEVRERVFDVAGDPDNGATVDPATCAPVGAGFGELCAVWRDPTFDPAERAFYYARVLENPTCRWSTLECKAMGVDPFAADCPAAAAAAGEAFADCCLGPATDPFLEPIVQERAWTSPIWYRPEAVARLRASVTPGRRAGADVLVVDARLGRLPPDLDLAATDLTVRVVDDDEIYAVTIPAGRLRRRPGGRFVLDARAGDVGGLEQASVVVRRSGAARIRLRTGRLDLSRADRSDHMVTVTLAAGVYRTSFTRRWSWRRGRLASS
jgi:hypothetical protein